MLSGTQPSSQFTEDVLLTDSVASVDFSARLYRAGGEFSVSEPVVSRLKELPVYKGVRYSIIVAWVVLLVFIVYVTHRFIRVWQMLLLLAMVGGTLVGTMLPEATMTLLTQRVAGLVPEPYLIKLRCILASIYGQGRFSDAGTEMSKLGHFLVFICFGLFAGFQWRKSGIYYALAAILVFAVVTEALQTLVYGRTTNIGDLIVDGAGALLGLVVGIVLAAGISLFIKPPPVPMAQAHDEEDI